jgi:tRNA G37 N-methylase Trm5
VRGWSSTVTIETVHGSFVSRRNDHITRQLQQFSAHTRNELAMLLSLVRAGDIIIDIGAHIGTFAIPLARRVGDEGKVYAFEADSGNFTLLEKNVELNNLTARIVPVNAIIHDRPARFRRIDPDPTNSGMFTFLPLTVKCPWVTSCLASEREAANPSL